MIPRPATNPIELKEESIEKFTKRGYIVKENGPVYFTRNMDQTAKWFEEVLGWYSEIDARDEKGAGTYGCVYNISTEIERLHIAPFTGIHLFQGEPASGLVAFMLVQGIDALYQYVHSHGWDQISEVQQEPWGAKTCTITTVDSCLLRFFE